MHIDLRISGVAAYILMGYWAAVGIVLWLRFGRLGRAEHLRDPKDVAFVAFWNLLDASKWTEEGIELHERWLKYFGAAVLSLIAVFVLLDALTS